MCKLLDDSKIRTIIIPGNHDYNINSELVKDNVTLLNDNYDYIHTFNESGVYTNVFNISDIEFHVFSPIDKLHPRFTQNNKIKIALLHEPVNYAKYDNGEVISGARFRATDLENYDYVMLGDIHLHQFLIKDKIAYSGSFVQKTKGEGVTKGYILWDLNDKTGQFNPIPLKEVYIKIDACNDKCYLPNIEKFQKIRHTTLVYKNCSFEYIENLKSQIKEKYGYINRIVDNTKNKETREEEKIQESHDEIIKKILTEAQVGEDMIAKVLEHHSEILRNRKEATYTTYKLNYMTWSNIFCYGEDNYINFNEFKHNLIMLNGKNKEGKSSIIDILIRVLFNECERGYKEDIVNKSKVTGNIKLSFNIADDEYVIEQVYNRISKKQFHRLYKNGENITKDTIVQTYDYLRNTIGLGEYKNFVNMTTALQNRKFLVDMPPKDFISLLTKITNIDILKDVEEENKKEINTLRAVNRKYEADIDKIPKVSEEEINKLHNDMETIKTKKDDCAARIEHINKEMIKISKDYNNTVIPDDLEEVLIKQREQLSAYNDQNFDTNIKIPLETIKKELWNYEKQIEKIPKSRIDAIIATKFNMDKYDKQEIIERIAKINEVCYKPPEKTFRSIDKLNSIINSFHEEDLLPLEKCDIQSLVKLNEEDKNDNLLINGLPDYNKIREDINTLEKKIKQFNDNFGSLHFSDTCDSCCKNRSNIYGIFDIRSESSRLAKLQNELSQKEEMMTKYQKAIDYRNNYEQNEIFKRNLKIKEKNQEITERKNIFLEARSELEELNNKNNWETLTTLKAQLNKIEEYEIKVAVVKYKKLFKVKEFLLLKENYAKNVELDKIKIANGYKTKAINDLTKLENDARTEHIKYNSAHNNMMEVFRVKNNHFENRNNIIAKVTENVNQIQFLEIYSKVISSKTGIPSYVLKNACKNVQDKCNNILAKITDFTIEIIFDKEIKIYTSENGKKIPAQMSSGMQKFLLDLIFRITLTEISCISCTKTLFVDEGFGALDKENFISVANILQKLKVNFDSLFIISHITELNSYVDITINIRKYDYLSKVQYGALSDNEKHIRVLEYMSNNSNATSEFKEVSKKLKTEHDFETLDKNGKKIYEYCAANGGIIKVLFDIPQSPKSTDKIYCRGCSKEFGYKQGFADRHIAAATYKKKHDKYILSLL